jgi:hypothetical protein
VDATRSIEQAFKANGYPTPEQCNDIRAKALAEDAEKEAVQRGQMTETLDEVIAYLTANRDHIAGIALVTVPFHNDKCVNADSDTDDGRSQTTFIGASYRAITMHRIYQLVKKDSAPQAFNPLEALLGGLR